MVVNHTVLPGVHPPNIAFTVHPLLCGSKAHETDAVLFTKNGEGRNFHFLMSFKHKATHFMNTQDFFINSVDYLMLSSATLANLNLQSSDLSNI